MPGHKLMELIISGSVVKYDPDAPKQRVCTLLLSQQTNLYQNYARGEEVREKGSKKAALD